MSLRLVVPYVILFIGLIFTYDLYSYGIDLKHTPLLMANPVLLIQAHYLRGGERTPVFNNCPEIAQFRKDSPYSEYHEIPPAAWDKCLAAVAPSTLVLATCRESQAAAADLLDEINSQNELVLGLEKYGIRLAPEPAYLKLQQFADSNACTAAVGGYLLENGLRLSFKPSQILNTERFSEGYSEAGAEDLLKLTTGELPAAQDFRISSIIVLSGIFIFLMLIYSVYMHLQDEGRSEE